MPHLTDIDGRRGMNLQVTDSQPIVHFTARTQPHFVRTLQLDHSFAAQHGTKPLTRPRTSTKNFDKKNQI